MTNGNAYAEVGGMYGGLQSAIGLFCLIALLRQDYYRPAWRCLGSPWAFCDGTSVFGMDDRSSHNDVHLRSLGI
ncbi:MAG: hypothetical protein CM15mP120_30040 [Pseudomonadota bacterium]|nr:MAG: hypothetical protein CM15mP120_30040 [Pseudomonadota bacterium]